MKLRTLRQTDPILAELTEAEFKRQQDGLELIASENYVSEPVLEALGTVFTNKYSEGYPKRRYYGGQENTDQIEQIAIDRAKALFGCDHANVQPLSGAIANFAAYAAWLELGDTILGMNLSHGGHLTHGSPVTVMSKMYNFIRYGMKDVETGEIDYDELRTLALTNKPKIILAGFSAYPRELDYKKISDIANEVGAVAIMDMAHIAGLIAGKALANPFDHGFHMCTTTTHKTLRGPRGGMILTNGTVSNPLKKVEKKIANLPTLVDRSVFPGVQGGPIMNIILAKAVAFGEAQKPEFSEYAHQVIKNSKRLADQLMNKGFKLVTNGTDNHMMVVDTTASFGVSGGLAERTLDKIRLSASKSTIPDDTRAPFDPSGLRIGTPAATSRGMVEKDMDQLAEWIYQAITHTEDEMFLERLNLDVQAYCKEFTVPGKSE
jgi:glycine hydroxymethyltransferase